MTDDEPVEGALEEGVREEDLPRPEEAEEDRLEEREEEGEDITELMWDLRTEDRIKNLTWWWWWWLFFIRNPENPSRPRQLMILWSTKNCDSIYVNDYLWERRSDIVKTGEAGKDEKGRYRKRKMTFDGMTGIWYFDGERMHEPYALERSDFTVEWRGGKGYVRPHLDNVYLFSGDPDEYRVLIKKGQDEFDFRITPWNDFLSNHRYKSGHYIGKMGYHIYKIYGSKVKGHVRFGDMDTDIDGTAYFQKVTVNAPAVPWFWGVFHTENGSYLDYFNPHFGLPARRKTADATSFWDRGYFSLSKQLQFYDAERDKCIEFRKRQVAMRKEVVDGLPTFWVSGDNGEQRLSIKVRAYSRAFWRFQQKYLGLFRSVLYYNEYPTEMQEFRLEDGDKVITLEDLGHVSGNIEHSWGWLV